MHNKSNVQELLLLLLLLLLLCTVYYSKNTDNQRHGKTILLLLTTTTRLIIITVHEKALPANHYNSITKTKNIINIIIIINKDIYCLTYNKPERPGITESIKSPRHIKINVEIISLEATFKRVHVRGRTHMFRKRVPDGINY